MSRLFLGIDIGGTKSHALIADAEGQAVGFGEGGPGNHEMIGYTGLADVLRAITESALASAGARADQIAGAGMGIAGYDWPCDHAPTADVVRGLELGGPFALTNDATIGLIAGASEGWGVGVGAGTGCNCRGRDAQGREGRVTGEGQAMGEHGGSGELVREAVRRIATAWTRRGPATRLADTFVERFGAHDVEDMLEGFLRGRYHAGAADAPLVFRTADAGDLVAQELIRWAGEGLGSLAVGVIRQLSFEALDFEVVMSGSFFKGSPVVADVMMQTIRVVAPGARPVRLTALPVIGGVLLGMQQVGLYEPKIRSTLIDSSVSLLDAHHI